MPVINLKAVLFLVFFLAALAPRPATSETAPRLGVASHFQSGLAPLRLQQTEQLRIDSLRDGLLWRDIETTGGGFRFDQGSGAALSALAARQLLNTVTLFPQGSQIHAGGNTVTGAQGIAAFARYAAAVAGALPDTKLEIGNEFNGTAFVRGDAAGMTPFERAELHARMLAAIAAEGVPADRIIGGAAHSIAAGYIWHMLDAGAGAHMSAVAIHPYTTLPEAFPRQIEVLRRHPAMAGIGVAVTEFGTTQTAAAADFFWRSYCSLALSGAQRADWYPLEPRGDGYAPVLDRAHAVTPMGRAYLRASATLAGRPVTAVRPDPFTYGCLFDSRLLVLWGEPRSLMLSRLDLTIRHADMRNRDDLPVLDPERVVLIEAAADARPIDPERDLSFGATALVADSFHQFSYPATDTLTDPPDPFERYLTLNGRRLPLRTCPGQDRPQAPWFPYLCNDTVLRAVLHDRGFTLGGNAAQPVDIVHALTTSTSAQLVAVADLQVNAQSRDGVEVALRIDGEEIARESASGSARLEFGPFDAPGGSRIEILLSQGQNPVADTGRFRLSLYDASIRPSETDE